MKNNQNQIIENLEKCLHFSSCSQNFCPLDSELDLRYGGRANKCRYMREPKKANIAGREFMSGGAIMPDVSLKSVPQSNLKWLNEASKTRWQELNEN